MKSDFYVDAILGPWKHDKKGSTKETMSWRRNATVKLHRDNAILYTDPEDFKEYKVYGEVTLTEQKLINIATSDMSLFRGVKLTKDTTKDLVIK